MLGTTKVICLLGSQIWRCLLVMSREIVFENLIQIWKKIEKKSAALGQVVYADERQLGLKGEASI